MNKGSSLPKRLQIAIYNLKKNKNLIITKADKGGKAVIMNKDDYIDKMNSLLNDNNVYKKVLSDPLAKWQRNFNKELGKILTDFPDIFNKFKAYLPSLPSMYGLPKIHKENCPMRPIVSTINSVNYKLAAWLSKQLSPLLNNISGTHLKNTDDFICKVKDLNISRYKMVSFDVDSLFTNVPIDECIELLETKLESFSLDCPVPNNILIKLIKLCTSECFFKFNDCFYKQTIGLPMGNPISPILSNLYMEFFEKQLFQKIDQNIVWYRFVDDVFSLLPVSLDPLSLLNTLNNQKPSINFKLEIEDDNKLPFLDTLLVRDDINSHLKFTIYRKPTHSNSYLHYFSNHSINVKLATIANMFMRAYKICSPEFIDIEIKYLFKVFYKLGYPKILIDKAHYKARNRFYSDSNTTKSFNFENILVIPELDDNIQLKKIANKLNINLVVKGNDKIGDILNNNNLSSTDADTGGVIYQVKCGDCSSSYVGETANFKRRKYSHKYANKNFDTNNAIVKHKLESDHRVDIDGAAVILKENCTSKRKLLESVIIQNVENFNFNKFNLNCDIFSNEILFMKCKKLNKCLKQLTTNHIT